jgi:hypothetical protein
VLTSRAGHGAIVREEQRSLMKSLSSVVPGQSTRAEFECSDQSVSHLSVLFGND